MAVSVFVAGCGSDNSQATANQKPVITPPKMAPAKAEASHGGPATMDARSMTMGPGAGGNRFGSKAGGN